MHNFVLFARHIFVSSNSRAQHRTECAEQLKGGKPGREPGRNNNLQFIECSYG